MTAALRIGAFRRLAALYTLNVVFEWVGSVALMVVVYDATSSSVATAGMLICKQIIPGFLIPVVGARLDRADLRAALALAWVGGSLSLLGVAVAGFGLWLFVLAMAAGLSAAVVRTGLRAAVVRAVGVEELRGANATLNLIMGIAIPIAPAFAAFVIHLQGAPVALIVTGACVALLAPLATTLPVFDGAPADSSPAEAGDEVRRSLASGPPMVPVIWLMMLGAVAVCASEMSEPSLLAYSVEALGAGVAGYGAICTAWALGVTAGSVIFTRLLGISMLRIYVFATLVSGVAYLGLSVAPTVAIACAIAAVGGLGTGMDWVAIVTAVQELGERGSEAELVAKLEGFAMAAPAVGAVIGGVIADVAGPRAALAAPGLLSLVAVALLGLGLAVRTRRPRLAPASAFVASAISGGAK